jgi:tetratricopeptide (TPR) repeat protein
MSQDGEFSEAPVNGMVEVFCRCQADFDFQFFQAVLERNPCHVDALRRQAELLAARGDHNSALALDLRLVNLLPNCCTAHYNLACSLAVAGNDQRALQVLARALELGYGDFAHIDDDVDLDSLREIPEFQALMARYSTA